MIMGDDNSNKAGKCGGKKADPGAPKITRPCTECGKKFWSWKALFGHMRCHPEREWRGINPPPNINITRQQQHRQHDQRIMLTEEDHEVAACLLLLAQAQAQAHANGKGKVVNKEEEEEEDMNININVNDGTSTTDCPSLSVERFECSSCKKVFGSHQALGGHRASHKNVKGCFARTDNVINLDNNNNEDMLMIHSHSHSGGAGATSDSEQMEGHKCSICLRVFSTGQALGGHKRCHWDKGDLNLSIPPPNVLPLDLNFPPPPHQPPPLTLDLTLGL